MKINPDSTQNNGQNLNKSRVLVATHHLPFDCILSHSPELANLSALYASKSTTHLRLDASYRRFSTSASDIPSPQHAAESVLTCLQQPFGYSPSSRSHVVSDSLSSFSAPNGSSSILNDSSSSSPPASQQPQQQEQQQQPVWKFIRRRDHAAVYSGILSVRDKYRCLYFGLVDKIYDENENAFDVSSLSNELKESLSTKLLADLHCIPVFADSQVSHGHYEGFCKTSLWPLFHYIVWSPTDGSKEKIYWKDYITVNQMFTDVLLKSYQEGDSIWLHDYHLFLAPSMLRTALPSAPIGMFLHTTFPSSEIFRCLPQRKDLLLGVLGANLIGFQTYSYARHFISSCTRMLGVESTPAGIEFNNSLVSIAIFPIGIDVKQIEEHRRQAGVAPKIAAIRELYAGKKIIIGRDKLDETKGVIHKLNAFERFLELHPEWQDKVVMIQVTSPTESSFKLETRVSETVSRINGNYGSLGFAPVHHYHHHIDRDEYYALLTIADVALITAVRDGMNTTSHEYVVCQSECHGPLILSEFTGTAGSLSAAILVNPWDYTGVASAIYDTLNMCKEEKYARHRQLYDYVTKNTAKFWADTFLIELTNTSRVPDNPCPTQVLDTGLFISKFKTSKKRLFFLDYDGTLTLIRKTPNAAIPSEEILRALTLLAQAPNTYVYIVSGRDQEKLEEWLGGIKHIGLSAEHGCFLRSVDSDIWENLSAEIDTSWKNDVLPIFERTPGSFVEHKRSSLTWHYRLADPQYGSWQAKECQNHLENAVLSKLPVEILVGKKNLEVRPQAINKGEILKRLLSQPLLKDPDFVFCAGDDKTDEDMFKVIRKMGNGREGWFTCTIGSATKKTTATSHVPRTEDIIEILSRLATEVETLDKVVGL